MALTLQPAQPLDKPTMTVSSASPEEVLELKALIGSLRTLADAFVFLSGGAARMSEDRQRQLLAMFDALAMVARSGRRIAVGDGGTQAGIMQAAGQAREASGRAFPLLGVAPARQIPPRGSTPIDPHHTHLVAVDDPTLPATGDAWGSETRTMYWIFEQLSAGRPAVTVVAGGGGITLSEVDENVRAGRTMILIEGSGRAADALVSLVKGTVPLDPDVVTLRARAEQAGLTKRPELYRIVPLTSGAAGLRDALIAELDRKP